MYCSDCGIYSTSGQHVCRSHQEVPAGVLVSEGGAVGVDEVDRRSQWAPLDGFSHAPLHEGAAAQEPRWESPHGQFLGAIPRTIGKRGRYDILVYERSLVFAKVPGADPSTIGFALGTISVGSLFGYIAGDYIGASGNRERIARLASRIPESIAGDHKRNRLVPVSSVASGEILSYGSAGGKLRLTFSDGTTRRHRWTRPHTRGIPAADLLESRLRGRVAFRTSLPWRVITMIAIVALSVLATIAAIAIPAFLNVRDNARFDDARAQVVGPCASFLEMSDRLEEGIVPTLSEIAAVVDPMVAPFAAAADIHDDFRPPAEDVARLSVLVHGPGTPEDLAEIGPAASNVYTACTW